MRETVIGFVILAGLFMVAAGVALLYVEKTRPGKLAELIGKLKGRTQP